MKVIFFIHTFPNLSETFIRNQIVGLLDLGVEIEIISIFEGEVFNDSTLLRIKSSCSISYLLGKKNNSLRHIKLKTCFQFIKNFSSLENKLKLFQELYSLITCRNKSAVLELFHIISRRPNLFVADVLLAHFVHAGYLAYFLREAGVFKVKLQASVCHGVEMSAHSYLKRWLPIYKKYLPKIELILPVSDFWKHKLIGWGVDKNLIHVHRMGIDIERFDFRPFSFSSDRSLRILSVGRNVEKKGFIYAISSLIKMPDVDYQVIGVEDGAFSNHLELGHNISLLGSRNQSQVYKALKWADVFLLPSVTAKNGDMEGLPVALMEAMACGKVVISTYHSGIPELISHLHNGLLCREKSVSDITENIQRVRSDIEASLTISLAARRRVERLHDNRKLSYELKMLLESYIVD